jgi:hypothetical protein
MEAAANFGENMIELKDRFGKDGDFWDLFSKNENSRGGVVGYASGGPAYLEGGLKPSDNPVEKESYLFDTLRDQEETKKNQMMQPGSAPGQPESTVSKIGNVAKTVAAVASLFGSDRRMKHSIRRIGKTDDGMPIYRFKYNGDENEQTHIGFMADEVERKHPDAVMTGSDGMKRVDYGQAHKFYQGGLVRPGYAPGGAPETEEEIIRRRLLAGDVPKPMSLGDLPNARVTPATALPAEDPDLPFVDPQNPYVDPEANRRVRAGLAPTTPREATPVTDLSGLAAAAIERSGAQPVTEPGLAAARAPEGGYAPIVPLKTQLDFVMHELAMPQYNRFLRTEYKTPEQAAIGFENIYEKANGVGNDRAAAYARDVYSAVSNGDMSGLPPNAVAAYEHFTANGMDPIKAAGATGRLMVESYEHMDPNARNTLGGGYGTYGVAQWRGPRIEALAEFAGVPLETIASAPVSSPEGDYSTSYSSSGLAGGAGSGSAGEEYSGGLGPDAKKPYDERNILGKMMYDPETNKLSRNALLSLASGVGSMLASPSQFFLPSVGLGLQGAASTYAGLEKQAADIRLQDAQTADYASQLIKNSLIKDEATNLTYIPLVGGNTQRFSDWLEDPAGRSMAGVAADEILRRIGNDLRRQGVDVDQIDIEQLLRTNGSGDITVQPLEAGVENIPGTGLPVQPEERPVEQVGTFRIGDTEQTLIDNNTTTIERVAPAVRESILERSGTMAQYAAAEATAASGTFRNLNELAKVIVDGSAENDLGPFGGLKASIDGILEQAAASVGIEYDGSAATNAQLLNKLSQLQANEITSGTAAAELFLRNKQMFPDISSDPKAAAEITAAAITGNMENYERGAYVRNIEAAMAQESPYVNLTGVDQAFTERTRNIYQTEKNNISTLLQAASNQDIPEGTKNAIKQFMAEANAGKFTNEADAQDALRAIFSGLPGEHRLSSRLGRYFVQ